VPQLQLFADSEVALGQQDRMPIRPSSTKKGHPGVANQRDTRHESGLVGPGKRVQKQRSNGHINGNAKPGESNSSTPPPLPSTPPPATNGHARQLQRVDSQSAEVKIGSRLARRPSFGASSESSSSDSFHNHLDMSVSHENHRRIDVNAAKNPAVHRDSGALNLAITVLQSCPLRDTIAILIVLLQLPPTFLSLVQLLFATLTFVPASGSSFSGFSLSDIFEGTMGTPSLATIIVIDVIVLLIWLFLWTPIQDIALDLAQTVIALTLGGGSSARESGIKNVLVCFSLVGASHFARNGNVKTTGFRSLISSSSSRIFGTSTDPDDPLEPMSEFASKKGTHGWIQNILAVHILTQGVVRFIRDLYLQGKLREKRDTSASVSDPEAGKLQADSVADSSTLTMQATDDSSANFVPGNASNTKKKKKQNAQVRVRQPLWAALASTKIVMIKEYETSHTAAESAGTNATDINNLGNAPFPTEADRIWITHVGSDEIHFSTSYFPHHTLEEREEQATDTSGIDTSKPFFVCINKASWRFVQIESTDDPEQPTSQNKRWSGRIKGLAAASSFECEFLSTVDNTVIFSTSVRTLALTNTDVSGALSPNPQGRAFSPTSTLKSAIATAEEKLSDEKNRYRKERKDQKSKLSAIRKEIDRLANSMSTSGGNDDRIKQKIQQNNLQMKQAEDAVITLTAEIKSIEVIPAEDIANHSSSKSEYYAEKDEHKKFRAEIQEVREATEREISTLNTELTTVQGKKERAQARIAKLNGEHERITDANAKGLDEAQRRERERHLKELERANVEQFFVGQLTTYETQITQLNASLQELLAAIYDLQQREAFASASPNTSVPNLLAHSPFSSPMAAEGHSMQAYPWNQPASSSTNAFPSFAPGPSNSMPPPQSFRSRGRSSSMLSNVSGFTQSDDEGPPPGYAQMGKASWDNYDKDKNGSSGSGSGPASVSDPKSPVVGNSKLAR
jgi:hypothetical protein